MSDILKAAKEALEGVTPGPWATHIVDETSVVSGDGIEVATTCDSSKVERADAYNNEYERMEADARFIAASRELVPALIARTEKAETEAAALRDEVAGRPDAPCTIVEYTNYRGETARRVIIPIRFWWGATEWHSDDQWMLTAYDVEKGAWRDFAWQDMRPVQNPATSAALARMKETKA